MSDPSSDEQDSLDMARLAAGHEASLNCLIERHGPRLFNYLLRLLHDEGQADEIAQEAFVRVYLNREKFRGASRFSTWLYAIATNIVRDHLRWKSRRPEVSFEAETDERQSFADTLPHPGRTPMDTLIAEERAEEVRCAVQALPEDLRTPFVLAEYEDLSQDEIAEILHCTRKAVEMRIYRARTELRQTLRRLIEETL